MENRMNSTPHSAPPRTVINRAAYSGLFLGAYLSILALLTGLSQSFQSAALLVWGASLGLPFMVYSLLRRSLAETSFESPFSEIWAEGIAMMLLASAIQAVVIYGGLRYLAPDYIANSVAMAIDYFEAMGTQAGNQWADTLISVRAANGLPAPTDVVAQVMSMNLIGGTFLTLVLSAVLKLRYASGERRRRYTGRRDAMNQ